MKGHSVDVKLDNTESARKQRASKRSERSHLKEVAEVYIMLLTLLNSVHNWPNLVICNVLVIIGTKKDLLNLPLCLIWEFEVTWSNYMKCISWKCDPRCSLKISFRSITMLTCETRGNIYKLATFFCKYDLKKYYFTNRVVPVWNSLPNSVLSTDPTNLFKSCLDKFWKSYDFVYDYETQPFSTRSPK